MMQHDDTGGEPAGARQDPPSALSPGELRRQRARETITLNRYLYQQTQGLERKLLGAVDLEALLEILLVELPQMFDIPATELWLYDPQGTLGDMLDPGQRFGDELRLMRDVFDLQELYAGDPAVLLIDATDSRMFEVLKSVHGANHGLLMPLLDGGRLVGSLHWGLGDDSLAAGEASREMTTHLAAIISICFNNAVNRQRLSDINLLDPVTSMGNRRGFDFDIAREISRARREERPLSLLLVEIDEYADLKRYHGTATCEQVVRKLADHITADLRATDLLARLSESRFAVLLPGAGEVLGQEVAERMCVESEDFQVDDGRGAVMHANLSIGLVTWEPQRYPAVDMRQLARQLETAAAKGVTSASARSGNEVVVSRLSPLMI